MIRERCLSHRNQAAVRQHHLVSTHVTVGSCSDRWRHMSCHFMVYVTGVDASVGVREQVLPVTVDDALFCFKRYATQRLTVLGLERLLEMHVQHSRQIETDVVHTSGARDAKNHVALEHKEIAPPPVYKHHVPRRALQAHVKVDDRHRVRV